MNIKDFFKNNQNDIILFIGVILISLISFGAGRLSAPKPAKEPIAIDESQVAAVSQTFLPQNKLETNEASQPEIQTNQSDTSSGQINTEPEKKQARFVASRSGKVYHWPWCSFAQKIKPENQVWFATEDEAQKAGYKRCSKFLEIAPADYQGK